MKKVWITIGILALVTSTQGQTKSTAKTPAKPKAKSAVAKKPVASANNTLLWEITGNGLKKPSYIFGTMHLSSKLVFNLPDSFYYAIKNVETVALELNPDVWQGQMVKLDQLQLNYRNFTQAPSSDYLNETSFQL